MTTKFRDEIKTKLFTTELEDLELFAARQNKRGTGQAYVYGVLEFCKEFDTTPHKLIKYDLLKKAQEKANETMSMEDAQKAEFLCKRIQKSVEDKAEMYVEKYKMKNIELTIALSALYALTLVLVFFISIGPAHDAMIKAKNDYVLKVHSEYRDLHEGLFKKLETKERIEPEEYSRLSGLYDLYKRVQSMAVWPLDFGTILRFSLTSLIPLISALSTLQFI